MLLSSKQRREAERDTEYTTQFVVCRVRYLVLICGESMDEMCLTKRLFYPQCQGGESGRGGERTRGSVIFYLAVSQPIVTTCTGMRAHISVSRLASAGECHRE